MIKNLYFIFVAVLVPTVMWFVWYKPKVLETIYLSASGMTEKQTNAMFEAKGFTYIAVNTGYWIISLTLMGGIVCR